VHFANISKFLKAESMIKQINSSLDIVNTINKRQAISNENNLSSSNYLLFLKSIFIISIFQKKRFKRNEDDSLLFRSGH
jgi:hypothetical protein